MRSISLNQNVKIEVKRLYFK
uniref:Uncharacterized protein n=1 Tax=Rhizophora mucronata TaxID=61149 RepID=A0A2P2PXC4_RHIMU